MADDIVIIYSDSDDDDVIQVKTTPCRPSTSVSVVIISEDSIASSRSVSFEDRAKNRAAYKHFPFVREFYRELRATFGVNFSHTKIMRIAGQYISILQEEILKHPSKCRLLAKNVCRTLLLFRALGGHFGDQPYYLQKISQLLAIYIYLELRYAEGFHDSKLRVAERIISNIHLHLKANDVSYILRIFAYIPHMGKDNEIVTKIFKRLIPEPVLLIKHEFNDRLYIQYLIAFYHWKDAESEYEDQQRVISFANRFMKPKSTLKTSLLYARHLPSYEKREDATQYFLSNLVFFNDLRNASLIDGLADSIPSNMIDLSDDADSMTVDYAEIKDDDDPVELAKPEQPVVVVENTEPAPVEWLIRLAERAVELEVKLPARLTMDTTKSIECVSLDSSDDEHWEYNEEELAAKHRALLPEDGETVDSFSQALNQFDLSTELAEDSSDKLFKQYTFEPKKRPVPARKPPVKSHSSNGRRINFKGIAERELKSVPSLLTKVVDRSTSRAVVSENVVSGSDSSVEEGTSKTAVPEIVLDETATPEEEASPGNSEVPGVSTEVVPEIISIPMIADEPVAQVSVENSAIEEVPSETIAPEVLSSEILPVEIVEKELAPSEIVVEKELAPSEIVVEKEVPEEITVEENNTMVVPESLPVEPVLTPEIIAQAEPDVIKEPTTQQEEQQSNLNDKTNSAIVAEILTSFAEVSTSLSNDSSNDNAIVQPIAADGVIDNTEVEKEAVTLSLNTFSNTFSSSEDESFLSHYNKPPLKTYLRKAFKKTEMPVNELESDANVDEAEKVDKENNNSKSDKPIHAAQEVNKGSASKNTPNVLFSGKVIPLREDDNAIGGLTPSYLKVPESVEVSSKGSNVVFSMQGRRLSSFPPLTVMSPNEQSMPDFDGDFFNEGEDTTTRENAKGPVADTTGPVVDTTEPAGDTTDNESDEDAEFGKPPTRRGVWFSGKNQYHEIDPRESLSSSSSTSSINSNTSTINKPNINKQQYQPSTTKPSQPDTNSTKIGIPTTTTNFPKRIISTTSKSQDTAALKSAQEQDLVQRLFPELFCSPNNKHILDKIPNPIKLKNVAGNPFAAIKNMKANATTKTISTSKTTSNKQTNRNTTQNNRRRKKVTTNVESEFDKYLEKKRKRDEGESQAKAEKEKHSARRMRLNNKRTAKSILETTNDVKLKMKPVVVLERLCETTYTARVCKKSKSVSVNNTTSVREVTKEICTQITETVSTVSSVEVVCGVRGRQSPARIEISTLKSKTTQSSCDVLAGLEQNVATPLGGEQSVLERENTSVRVAETSAKTQSIVPVDAMQTVAEITPKDTVETTVTVAQSSNKPPSPVDKFKKPLKSYTSRGVGPSRSAARSPYKKPSLKKEKVISCTNTLENRLKVEKPVETVEVKQSNKTLPPNTDECHSLETGTHDPQPGTSNAQALPTKEVKVKLKRCNFEKGYVVVENTAAEDLGREGDKDACGNVELEMPCPDEKKHRKDMRKKGSAARKREAMKRIYQENPNILFLGPRSRRTFGDSNHLSCINTPPPTPPSPSLSPAPPSLDTNPTTDDTSQDGSEIDSHAEPNNNNVRPTFPLLHHEDRPTELSRYLSSSSMVYKEYCDLAKIPRELEINKDYLLMYYEYLDNRNDDRAKTEMQKLIPLFESKLFNLSGPHRKRKRFESYSPPLFSEHRLRKISSSDNTATVGSSSWCSMASKRRKTICTDLHYLNQSPDFLFDEEICSSTKAADSPTLEVMRLHTVERSVQPKPSTIVSSSVVEPEEEQHVECEMEDETPAITGPVRSPNLFSECSSSTTQTRSAAPTPVQPEFDMDNEDCGSPSRRTNCESPPEVSRIAVSRTYSKSNMVQHVFVPPEIEKCIEEQSSAVVVDKEDIYNMPSTSKKHSSTKSRRNNGRKTKKIPEFYDSSTSNDDDTDDDNDNDNRIDDDDNNKDAQSQEVNISVATTSVKRTRRKTKTSHRRKKIRIH